MSATWRSHSAMSAFGGKADITRTRLDVRFWPKADIRPPVYVHCTSIALTHKIHTLSTLQSEMLGVAQQHRVFPKLGGACSATGLRRRILSLEYLLRPWRDVGGGPLLVFWVGVGRQPSRCFTPHARSIDNLRKSRPDSPAAYQILAANEVGDHA